MEECIVDVFARRMRAAIADKNISLEEISKRTELDLKHVKEIYEGGVNVRIKTAAKIAAALEVEWKDLLK